MDRLTERLDALRSQEDPPPRRRHRLVLDLHADTLDDLSSALTNIDLAIRSRPDLIASTGGGTNSGVHWELTTDEAVTHDTYLAELTAWRARSRGIPTGTE